MINLNQKLIKDIKKENEKTFYKKIDKIVHSLIGHKLITFTVIDEKLKFCERVYSNNNKIYPILGQKKCQKISGQLKFLKINNILFANQNKRLKKYFLIMR